MDDGIITGYSWLIKCSGSKHKYKQTIYPE
jgi:hypothetical protein